MQEAWIRSLAPCWREDRLHPRISWRFNGEALHLHVISCSSRQRPRCSLLGLPWMPSSCWAKVGDGSGARSGEPNLGAAQDFGARADSGRVALGRITPGLGTGVFLIGADEAAATGTSNRPVSPEQVVEITGGSATGSSIHPALNCNVRVRSSGRERLGGLLWFYRRAA